MDSVLLGIFVVFTIFAALVTHCPLAIHIVAVIATIYHWDFLTFCSIFPFHAFLVYFFVPCSKGGLRVFGVSRLGLVLLVRHRRHQQNVVLEYVLSAPSIARPGSSSERSKVEEAGGSRICVRTECT